MSFGDAGVRWGAAVGLDALTEGVEEGAPFGEDRHALGGLVVEGVEVVEELTEEVLAGDGGAQGEVEVGGEVADFTQGIEGKVDVDADAQDCVVYLIALDGGLDEDAGDLLALEDYVVGPLDAGVQAGAGADGADYGDAGEDANHG